MRLPWFIALILSLLFTGCSRSTFKSKSSSNNSSARSQGPCFSDSDCSRGQICAAPGVCLSAGVEDTNAGSELKDTTSQADIQLPCRAVAAGDLVINEILADPTPGLDANGDGIVHSGQDEFVEIVNPGTEAVALTGVELMVKGTVKHSFGLECLGSGQAVVVFSGGEIPDPQGFMGSLTFVADKSLSLVNSGGSVSLGLAEQTLDSMDYGSEGGSDQSLTRYPDLVGEWMKHKEADPVKQTAMSPGTCVDGEAFPNCGLTNAGSDSDTSSENPPDGGSQGMDVVDLPCPKPEAGDLVINEILADPPDGDVLGDANGDGIRDGTGDEFVEVVNTGSSPVAMTTVELQVKGNTKHVYGPTCLNPGQAFVVFGGETISPDKSFGGAKTAVSDTKLGLTNSGATVTLTQDGITLDSVDYGSEGGKGQSINRSPELSGSLPFVLHSEIPYAGGALMSPGTCADGAFFPDCGFGG